MLTIRKANKSDQQQIKVLLQELDLYYSALEIKDFWLAEENNIIIATMQLKKYPNFLFLGSLGVKENYQKKGRASKLINAALKDSRQNVYLYTIIPDFFRKFGFEICQPIPGLPSKDNYECEDCHSERCVCMVKKYAA